MSDLQISGLKDITLDGNVGVVDERCSVASAAIDAQRAAGNVVHVVVEEEDLMQRDTAKGEPSLNAKKIAFIKKQKEIIQDIASVLARKESRYPAAAGELTADQQKRFEQIKERLSVSKSKVEFARAVASFADVEPFNILKIEEFISGLDLSALDVLTGVTPGRDIYLTAIQKGEFNVDFLKQMFHSRKFGEFHYILTEEVPKILGLRDESDLYTFGTLWSFCHIRLSEVSDLFKSSPITAEVFGNITKALKIDVCLNGHDGPRYGPTALHLLGAPFIEDLKSLGNAADARSDLFSSIAKGSSIKSVDIKDVLAVFTAYQGSVEACQLLDNELAMLGV